MKSITIAGNIGRDAETRNTQNGDKVTSWTVAVEDRSGKDKSTLWFDCSLWGARGEKLAQYLTKGSKVVVSGDLGKREHDGKTYLTVRADNVTLMGARGDEREERREEPRQQGRGDDFGDTIPFTCEWRI